MTQMMSTLLPVMLLIGAIVTVFLVFCFWRIFTRAGMAGALSLLILLPGIGPLVVVCILAFGTWGVTPVPSQYGALPPTYPPTQL
jgi:hypothetical protein